jgi:hypothetical protein
LTHRAVGLNIGSDLVDGLTVGKSSKVKWVTELPHGESDRGVLANRVDTDHDDFEVELYEHFTDPEVVARDRDQRRYRGQFMRRLRRRRFPQ